MRAAVEAIRLASVLPSPAGPVTVEHRHERGRSIADRAVDHLPRPRDAGMAMGGEQPDREVQCATAEIADQVQRRHGLARRADRVERDPDRDLIVVVDRKSVCEGKSVSVRLELGDRRIINNNTMDKVTQDSKIYQTI